MDGGVAAILFLACLSVRYARKRGERWGATRMGHFDAGKTRRNGVRSV